MASLRPDRTGLPLIVWVSERGDARHDVHIKLADGPRAPPFKANVALRPEVRLTDGHLSASEFRAAEAWVRLNFDVLIAYWDQQIDTAALFERLQRLP
jgi:hypothetical protein